MEALDAEGNMEQSETEDILSFADEVLETLENEETNQNEMKLNEWN